MPIGRHEYEVKYFTIGGVDTGKSTKFEVRVNHADCEKSTFAYTAACSSGTKYEPTLGDDPSTIDWCLTQTSAKLSNGNDCSLYWVVTTIPSDVTSIVTADTSTKKYSVAKYTNSNKRGPFTLEVTPQTVEGDNTDTKWTRDLHWKDVCNDGLIVATAFTSNPSYTLWTDPGTGIDVAAQITTTTHDFCAANVAYTWTMTNAFKALIKSDYETTKKIVFTKFDDKDKAGDHAISIALQLDGSGPKTFAFTVTIVDGCAAITTTTVPTSTQQNYYEKHTKSYTVPAWTTVPTSCKLDYEWDPTGLDSKWTSVPAMVFDGDTDTRTFTPAKTYEFFTNFPSIDVQAFKVKAKHRGVAVAGKELDYSIKFNKDVCEVANGFTTTPEPPTVALTFTLGQSTDVVKTMSLSSGMVTPDWCLPARYGVKDVTNIISLLTGGNLGITEKTGY